jgi:hypothetical protein
LSTHRGAEFREFFVNLVGQEAVGAPELAATGDPVGAGVVGKRLAAFADLKGDWPSRS